MSDILTPVERFALNEAVNILHKTGNKFDKELEKFIDHSVYHDIADQVYNVLYKIERMEREDI